MVGRGARRFRIGIRFGGYREQGRGSDGGIVEVVVMVMVVLPWCSRAVLRQSCGEIFEF